MKNAEISFSRILKVTTFMAVIWFILGGVQIYLSYFHTESIPYLYNSAVYIAMAAVGLCLFFFYRRCDGKIYTRMKWFSLAMSLFVTAVMAAKVIFPEINEFSDIMVHSGGWLGRDSHEHIGMTLDFLSMALGAYPLEKAWAGFRYVKP